MPIDPTLLLAQAQSNGAREVVDNLARTPLSQVVAFVAILTVIRLGVFPVLKNTKPHLRTGFYPIFKFVNEMVDAFIYAGVFVFMLIRPFGIQAFLVPSGSMWPTLNVNNFIVANKAIYRYSDPKANDIVVFRPPASAAIQASDLDAQGDMKVDYVKRCIGAPGDIVELKKGIVYRNGNRIDESYRTYSECVDKDPMVENCQSFKVLSSDVMKQVTLPSFKLVKINGQITPLSYTDHDANSPTPQPDFPTENSSPYRVARKFQIDDTLEQKKAMSLPAEKVPPGFFLMMGDNRNNSHDGRVWGLVPRSQIIGRAEFVWWPLPQIHRTQ